MYYQVLLGSSLICMKNDFFTPSSIIVSTPIQLHVIFQVHCIHTKCMEEGKCKRGGGGGGGAVLSKWAPLQLG